MKTIPNSAKVHLVTYRPVFSAVCSVGKAPFHGTLTITYAPGGKLLEFESFENWLRSIAKSEQTIESFNRVVFDELSNVLGNVPLSVTVDAATQVHAPVKTTISRGFA